MGNACLLAAALLPNEMLHPKLPLLSLSTEIQLVNLQQRFTLGVMILISLTIRQ